METKHYSEEIDFQNYWLVLKRRWLVATSVLAATIGLTALITSAQRPNYKATGQVLVQADRTTSLTGISEKIGSLESLKREGSPLETQAVVLLSQPVLQQVIDSLGMKDSSGRPMTVDDLRKQIKVEAVPNADVLKLSYNDSDRDRAADVVNQVMKAYIANSVSENQKEAVSAGQYIEKELPRALAEFEQASQALSQFKTQNQVVDLKREMDGVVRNATALQDQFNQAQGQLAELAQQEAAASQQVGTGSAVEAVNAASLSQSAGVQEAQDSLQRIQSQLEIEQTRFGARHPAIATLRDQEARLKGILAQRISEAATPGQSVVISDLNMGEVKQKLAADFAQLQGQRQGLERKVQVLNALQAQYRQRAAILPTLEKRESELAQRVDMTKKAYENLAVRLQDISVAKTQRVENARIIQPAVAPSNAEMGFKLLLLAGSGLVGLLLGIGAAFFVDLIDRSLKTVKEAETLYGYTLLGLIPKFETSDTPTAVSASIDGISPRVITMTTPRSVLHEAYQMLQANLKFISLDKRVKTIAISSAVAREGKSEVTANLAASIAQAGKRVLLIDADMRNPSQHHLWGLVNTIGLSNVVVDQDELAQAIRPINSHLSVLTAGVMPPNPLAIIDSEAMTAFLDRVSRDYDYVLFDTPPLAGTADASVLGKMADGVLVVVRPGVTDSASATAAKSVLARSESNVLGLVANGVNTRFEPDGYFYYTSPRESAERSDSSRRLPRSLSTR